MEDHEYGDVNPHRLPESLNTKEKRLKKLEEAKKRLEGLEQEKKEKEKNARWKPKGSKGSNTTRTNLTDPDSRLLKSQGAYYQGYNCQAVVDEKSQVVVAASVGNSPTDYDELAPMLVETRRVNGVLPGKVLADSGYFSFDNLEKAQGLGIDAYIPDQMYYDKNKGEDKPGNMFSKDKFKYDKEGDVYVCPLGKTLLFDQVKRSKGIEYRVYVCNDCLSCNCKKECTSAEKRSVTRDPREHLWEEMRAKLESTDGKKTYAKRMFTVEPVFGNIKKNLGFKEFTLRGLVKTSIEFLLVCTVHNLGKIGLKIKQKQDMTIPLLLKPSFIHMNTNPIPA